MSTSDFEHHFADLGDVMIHYVTAGPGLDDGPPIVLVHGWPQTWYEWRHVMPSLAAHHPVIVLDMRGLGDSSRPLDGYDKRTVAGDVFRLLTEHLGLERWHGVGHDWGGPVTFALGAAHPRSMLTMTIIDVVVPGDGGDFSQGGRRWHHAFHATDAADLGHRLPTQDEIACAAQAVTVLAHARGGNDVLAIHREGGESVRLAPAIADLVIDLLGGVASGKAVTLVPAGEMLTTQQAADILGVSRPHLSKLLKSGRIPFVSVGSHRRVMHADLMAYMDRRDAARHAALDDLARLGIERAVQSTSRRLSANRSGPADIRSRGPTPDALMAPNSEAPSAVSVFSRDCEACAAHSARSSSNITTPARRATNTPPPAQTKAGASRSRYQVPSRT